MNKKTGLGKGLNALFADTPIVEENIQEITEENKEFIIPLQFPSDIFHNLFSTKVVQVSQAALCQ